ncbi:hypothetical protein ACO0QE_003431 [Hanseniaspora vineae]
MAKPKQAQTAANSTITQANNSSFTVWSPQDTVRDVAESLGIGNISDDVLRSLAMDVEYRILEIIEQAVKFKRHSKRETLTSDDIAKSLKVLNVEPLYGYAPGIGVQNFTKTQVGVGPQQQNLYCLNDEEVDFDELINEPLPPAPRIPSFTAHWLAVEGVQPAIPQNPPLTEIRHNYPPFVRGAIVTSINENSLQTVVPEEDLNEEITEKSGALNGKQQDSSVAVQQSQSSQAGSKIAKSIIKPGSKELEVKPRVKHVLSRELQIYFEKVCEALLDQEITDAKTRVKTAALHSLKNDTGLHQLVPYFISFISEQITYNLDNLALLATILEMMYSLLCNESIFLDPYIHTLMPPILTLLLAKNIGNENNTLEQTLGLRDFASELLNHVLHKFPKLDKTLKPRLTRTLLKSFLDTNRTMGTYYGCFRGVMVLGPETVRFFMGNLHNWAELVIPSLQSSVDSPKTEPLLELPEKEAQKNYVSDNKDDLPTKEAQDQDVNMTSPPTEQGETADQDVNITLPSTEDAAVEKVQNDENENNNVVSEERKNETVGEELPEADEPPLEDNNAENKIAVSSKENAVNETSDEKTDVINSKEKVEGVTGEDAEQQENAKQSDEMEPKSENSGSQQQSETPSHIANDTEKSVVEANSNTTDQQVANDVEMADASSSQGVPNETKIADTNARPTDASLPEPTTENPVPESSSDVISQENKKPEDTVTASSVEKMSSKFTNEEFDHLVKIIIEFLKTLEQELPPMEQSGSEPLSVEEFTNLQNRVGQVVAERIKSFSDHTEARKLYKAIFFGTLGDA